MADGMINIYSDDDFLSAHRQYKKIIGVYVLAAAVYALFVAAAILYYISLPYKDSAQTVVKVIFGVVTAAFVIFSYPYLGIKVRRIKAYHRLLGGISAGLKNTDIAYFSHIDDWEEYDKVDVNVLVFKKWNGKKREWDERKLYIDAEKDVPGFKENEEVRVVTFGNIIVQYRSTGNFCEDK